MPLKAKHNRKYPLTIEWRGIWYWLLTRAGFKCEACGIPQYAVGYRVHGEFIPARGNGPQDAAGQGRSWPSSAPLTYREACELADARHDSGGGKHDADGHRWIVVVLTIAHLDHDPQNTDHTNLRILCQQCHARHRQQNPARRLRRLPGWQRPCLPDQGDLLAAAWPN